ncbi:forkhead box protein i1 [Moniliophthora roreri MCA 2997]|uniref:Forkhead box protein i1 n=1 Tax=Moniliophthora roreri (strain MCA 2997) TaxID=1381753 RepID=V2XME0_MONRO|nr:forkhead box protein i1 [Moniliophthora roreri MCA 2997]KAI3619635.1 forkhead box protein i1 [Moniliophthora roreri]
MAASDASPISQLLNSLGLTREDLHRRSDEMRQFLTADSSTSRVFSRDRASSTSSRTNLHSGSRSNSTITTSARSLSRASSISFREDASPSPSPVKAEPVETGLPPRQMDTMEAVLERQRRARREKRQRKGKERELATRASQSSPTPAGASGRGSGTEPSFIKREDRSDDASVEQASSVAESEPPPLTPSQAKYYREHTVNQGPTASAKVESPAVRTTPPSQATKQYYPYHQYLAQSQLLPPLQNPRAGPSDSPLPVTPQNKRILPSSRSNTRSPLPPSSPPVATPQSSPTRVVNLVSSPGPMGPEPDEESYNRLPYKLPAGPYSPNKPDLSYAALLGQAILSSAEHRLTLQEIYDWITIVYPFFKRGETTWMNSIRHVLSTTACFRKVTRDRALGRTQWAIWDEDLECFKNGGFRKQFCKDMNGGKSPSEVMQSTRGGKRARKVEDGEGSVGPKTKRAKKDKGPQRTILPAATPPIFPTVKPAPQTQSYYETCAVQSQKPSNDLFVPSTRSQSGTQPLTVKPSVTTSSVDSQPDGDDGVPDSDNFHAPPPSSSSTCSMPELTPNCSSSSPPPTTSDLELDAPIIIRDGYSRDRSPIGSSVGISGIESSSDDDADSENDSTNGTKLTPVQFWGSSPRRKDAAKSTARLKRNSLDPARDPSDLDQDQPLLNAVKRKNAKQKRTKLAEPFSIADSSIGRTSTSTKKARTAGSKAKPTKSPTLKTPPPVADLLSTPPRNTSSVEKLQLSPLHTPLSHKGLHMSPSASLAHYKTNLDPPPVTPYNAPDDDDLFAAFLHTPLRGPVTPKRFDLEESPYRPPLGISPFRMPSRDDHDPRSLLDEELNRLGAGQSESPPVSGLFGKRRELLYESPNALDSSPGKWGPWSRW